MTGQLLHRWAFRFDQAFPDADLSSSGVRGTKYWRRVALLPEGRLLAIYEGQGLIELDRDSNLIWAYPGWAHHDLEVHADGKISVLTREVDLLPRINEDEPVMHDWIVVLDGNGKVLDRISILQAIEASDFRGLLDLTKKKGDLFHTNTLELLDGSLSDRLPAFAAGNYLISLRTINTIAVVDIESRRVTWAMSGLWEEQHQPSVLPTGNILIFDNKGAPGGSRIVEFDPVTQIVDWQFDEDGELDSPTCGSVQRLPNGNTLITESETGRALEVTTAGELAWEYLTPNRAGDDNELVATLFEVVRLPPQTDLSWIDTR